MFLENISKETSLGPWNTTNVRDKVLEMFTSELSYKAILF